MLMTDTTTADGIFSFLVRSLDWVGVDWAPAVSLVTRVETDMDRYKDKITGLVQEFQQQFHDKFKDKFASAGLDTFYQYDLPGYPKLTALAAKALCMFGTTYLCEQAFSVMSINKTKLHARLTHKHLNDMMKLATAEDLMPDIDALVKAKRCQVSGAS